MGVLNVTPDSFSDGGRYVAIDAAVQHGLNMVAEGAAIIDVGGESTRPGADPVTVQEELRRVVPVIEQLRRATAAILSIDTSQPQVMQAAAVAGVDLINDIRALRISGAVSTARDSGCAVCLMHMRGEPATMQRAPAYEDVVSEVGTFLRERVAVCRDAGIAGDRLLIDPGFGFGKTLQHNLELLRRLRELAADVPVMVGLSRKSMAGRLTGRPPEQRLFGSVALAMLAVFKGARILRVHDVAATVDALNTLAAVED
ncbi:MAG TPA: dihydropteroate synthase [Steroidobacteraceae bacterium]